MSMLDALTSLCCGAAALALFTIHSHTSPKRTVFFSLPPYVRLPILLAGITLMIRSVNFTTLVSGDLLGRANVFSLVAASSLAWALCAICHWIIEGATRGSGWATGDWVRGQVANHPDLAPVMMPRQDVAMVARVEGVAALAPNAGPEELLAATRAANNMPPA